MFKKGIFFGFLFLAVIGFACGGGYIRFDIEPIDSPKVAGVPFLLTITSEDEIHTPIDLFLDDTTHTIQPRRIPNFMERWEGMVTIVKSGTTSITASTGIIDVESNRFFINPASPARFIVYPTSPTIEATGGGSITIKALLIDDYGNPIKDEVCEWNVLSFEGQKGSLSTHTSITNQEGEVFVTYTLPDDKDQLSLIEIQTKDAPEVWGISGKITTKRED